MLLNRPHLTVQGADVVTAAIENLRKAHRVGRTLSGDERQAQTARLVLAWLDGFRCQRYPVDGCGDAVCEVGDG